MGWLGFARTQGSLDADHPSWKSQPHALEQHRACAAAIALVASSHAAAQSSAADELLSAVVQIKTYINPDGRTVERPRPATRRSGIVIDDKGLILTIGYLMVEAHSAEVVTNRAASTRLKSSATITTPSSACCAPPSRSRSSRCRSAIGRPQGTDAVLAASFGGRAGIAPAYVMSLREFAAGWECLDPGAIFTAPAHWNGAARRWCRAIGKLVGVGSLVVGDVTGQGKNPAGQHVCPDRPPAADHGRSAHERPRPPGPAAVARPRRRGGARPISVSRVTGDGPAESAPVSMPATLSWR